MAKVSSKCMPGDAVDLVRFCLVSGFRVQTYRVLKSRFVGTPNEGIRHNHWFPSIGNRVCPSFLVLKICTFRVSRAQPSHHNSLPLTALIARALMAEIREGSLALTAFFAAATT